MKILNVVGARPNFMKIAPLMRAFKHYPDIECLLVHTGQHYDESMSKQFFEDLDMPRPDINLEVGSSSHATQTAKIMERFEPICLEQNPTHVLVVGDVNSTIACALVASKLGIRTIHVEGGLRSFDRSMPEEINRILTDAISDLLFITEESARNNLIREGVPEKNIYLVGNVMIDTLLRHKQKAEGSQILKTLGFVREGATEAVDFVLLTLHRPSNVDDEETFLRIIRIMEEIASDIPILFPVHPRTRQCIDRAGMTDRFQFLQSGKPVNPEQGNIYCTPALGYIDFVHLLSKAVVVVSDSGGIQEETTILGTPCLTLRHNTERPITVSHGTNQIVGTYHDEVLGGYLKIVRKPKEFRMPPLWDGKAAERIVEIIHRVEAPRMMEEKNT